MSPKPATRNLLRSKLPIHVVWGASLAFTVVLAIAAPGQTFSVLYTFQGATDGAGPLSPLAVDKFGNLYGASFYGGDTKGNWCGLKGCGNVFLLSKKDGWTFSVIYAFQPPPDGNYPNGVVFGPDGNLYGTTLLGGILAGQQNCPLPSDGCGVVFEVKHAPGTSACITGACKTNWIENQLYAFTGMNGDGAEPQNGQLAFDASGNIYGTTESGGANVYCGAFYKLTRKARKWTEEIPYSFQCNNQNFAPVPQGGVIFDKAGNLYGTTIEGGQYNEGTVYQLTPSGSTWNLNVLHSFNFQLDGASPANGIIFDGSGNIYGGLGDGPSPLDGAVFELLAGDGWALDLLQTFPAITNGFGPYSPLAMDAAGNLYGTTVNNGAYGAGNIFELTPSPSGWTYTDLYDFRYGTDGADPFGGVTIGPDGHLYGATFKGGDNSKCPGIFPGCGTIWELTP
jgi:uncharacterized repeat protein (TIGR03803 family)